jgi:hypothetical protein
MMDWTDWHRRDGWTAGPRRLPSEVATPAMELRMNPDEEVQWLRLRILALEAKASEAEGQIRNLGWGMLFLLAVACADFIRIFVG